MFWLFYFIIFIVLTQKFYGLFVVLYLEIYIIMHWWNDVTLHWRIMNENIACMYERKDAVSNALATKWLVPNGLVASSVNKVLR